MRQVTRQQLMDGGRVPQGRAEGRGARVIDATVGQIQLGQRPRHLPDATHHTRQIKHDKVTHGLKTTHRIVLNDKAGIPEYK